MQVVRRPDSVPAEQTSQLRWAQPAAPIFTEAPFWLAYAEDAVAHDHLRRLGCPPSALLRIAVDRGPGDELGRLLADDLAAALAGTRLLFCGREVFVTEAATCARRLGASDDEIVALPLDAPLGVDELTRERRVYCGACAAVLEVEAAVGDLIDCPSCGAAIVVHYHYSRGQAALLGRPDATFEARGTMR
jgi:predicted RNA-binding Zn-ribbon protein involved in translation (DUF1610 family)